MQVPPPREASLKKVLLAVLIGMLALMGFLTCTFVVVGVTGGFDSEPSASEVIVPISPIPENVAEPTPTQDPTRVVARTPTATPTSVPRPTSTSTPTPLATPTALPIPTPTLAPLGARPTVTPYVPIATPRPTGLGVGRQTVIDAFEDVGFEIDFEDAPLLGGTPRLLGISTNGRIIVELIGSRRNLTEASVTVGVTSNNSENVTNGLAMLVLLITTTSWEGGTEWLTNAIGRIDDEKTITTTRNGYRIRLEFWDLVTSPVLYLDITR